MRLNHVTFIIAIALVSPFAFTAETEKSQLSPAELLERAEEAIRQEDYDAAIERYSRLRELIPQSARLPYNMGVAAYRGGDYDRAAELFREALAMAEDPAMRSTSAYNLGTTAYARTLDPQPHEAGGAQPMNAMGQLDEATKELAEALRHYRQAIDMDPDSEDAKVNAELAYRRLKRLEALKEQLQEQQQQQQQEQEQEQEQESDEEQSQQQQQSPGQDEQENQPQEQQPKDQEEHGQQPQQEQPQQAAAPEEEDQRQPEPEESAEAEQQAEAAEADPQKAEDEERQRRTMTREEAERLLQSVRDKERRRREERARRERAERPPVDKDW